MKIIFLALSLLLSLPVLANDNNVIGISTCVSVYTRSHSEVKLCSDSQKHGPTTIYSVSFKTDKGSLTLNTNTVYAGVDSAQLNAVIKIIATGNGFGERAMTYILGSGKRSLEKVSTGELTLEEATRRFAEYLSEC